MSDLDETLMQPLAAGRDGSIEARREARLAKAKGEWHIVDLLNRGVSVADLAAAPTH